MLVAVDFIEEFLAFVGLLFKEDIHSLVLLQQEEELVVDVYALRGCLEVLINNSFDFVFGGLDNLVVVLNAPKLCFVGRVVCDGVVSTRDGIHFFDHCGDNLHQVGTHVNQLVREPNLIGSSVDLQLECQEGQLEL